MVCLPELEKLIPLLLGILLILPANVSAKEDEASNLSAPTLSYKIVCGTQPQGEFFWNAVSGASGYKFLIMRGQTTTVKDVSGTSITINLSAVDDYKYQVESLQPGKKEGAGSNSFIVKGIEVSNKCKSETVSSGTEERRGEGEEIIEDSKEEEIESTASSVSGDKSDLEKKVGELSKQLEQAKERQNALEKIVNDLLSFIKNLFRL